MLVKNKIILEKIISEINIGINFLNDITIEEFLKSELLKRATAMVFVEIGEFSKTLDFEFKKNNLQIDWREISDFGEKIIQNYFSIRMEEVYNAVKNEFPELKAQIEQILESDAA